MVSEHAEPPLHGANGPRIPPQSGNQPLGGYGPDQERNWSRTQRAAEAEASSPHRASQRGTQQAFENEPRANGGGAPTGSRGDQSTFSASNNPHYTAADPTGGYQQPFSQSYFNTPFGPAAFANPFGMPGFWPTGAPPVFPFSPFGAMPQSTFHPGMPPFGFYPFSDQAGQFGDAMRAFHAHPNVLGWWSNFRSLWSYLSSSWMWLFSGLTRAFSPLQSANAPFDASLQIAMTQADVMHQTLLKAAEMVDHARNACRAFAEHGGVAYAPVGPTPPFSMPGSSGPARPGGSVDMERLRQSLQTMDPTQAAQVLHAVQVVQAMDASYRRQRGADSSAW